MRKLSERERERKGMDEWEKAIKIDNVKSERNSLSVRSQ